MATLLGAALFLPLLACSGGGDTPPHGEAAALETQGQETEMTEDGEVIFREDFESGELPANVIQGEDDG